MKTHGLTILEVMIALIVMGVVMILFSTSFVGSMKVNNVSGQRTQSVQILALVGKLSSSGLTTDIPVEEGDVVTWDYGELAAKLPQIAPGDNQNGQVDEGVDFANIDLYKVNITNRGTVTFIGSTLTQFDVEVCGKSSGQESCTQSTTIGPVPQVSTTPPSS